MADGLTVDRVAGARTNAVAHIRTARDSASVDSCGRKITFPSQANEAVRFVLNNSQFVVREVVLSASMPSQTSAGYTEGKQSRTASKLRHCLVQSKHGYWERLFRLAPASLTALDLTSASAGLPEGRIYQSSFKANWICREVVAVEVI